VVKEMPNFTGVSESPFFNTALAALNAFTASRRRRYSALCSSSAISSGRMLSSTVMKYGVTLRSPVPYRLALRTSSGSLPR
jgi:hypothetical protein